MTYLLGLLLDFVISITKRFGATAVFSYIFITFRVSLWGIFIGMFSSIILLMDRFVKILFDFITLINSASTSNDCTTNIFFAVLTAIGFSDAFNNFIPIFISIGTTFFSIYCAIMIYKLAIFIDKTILSFVLVHK